MSDYAVIPGGSLKFKGGDLKCVPLHLGSNGSLAFVDPTDRADSRQEEEEEVFITYHIRKEARKRFNSRIVESAGKEAGR